MRVLVTAFMALLLLNSSSSADEAKASKPGERDKCPVCGMFVAKYPGFLAQIVFTDGKVVFFDGTKDLFKYHLEMKKYAPSRSPSEVSAIYVNDYYALKPIDGKKAFYVIGSNIHGPMGNELIAFEKEADANEFMFDHLGKRMLPFAAVTLDIVKSLE